MIKKVGGKKDERMGTKHERKEEKQRRERSVLCQVVHSHEQTNKGSSLFGRK
jgi:hypothetical protein